jgi:hypothetical protein
MPTALVVLLIVGSLIIAWSSARNAAELARRNADALCKRHGLQLLDQTVALARVRLARDADGRIALERRFNFDFSSDAVDRQRGSLVLIGDELQGATLPAVTGVNGVAL